MGIEHDKTMKVANHIPRRSCHICGRPCEGWCPNCLAKYCGPNRRPPDAMTLKERAAEIEQLLSPPYEIPMLAIYKRICALMGREIILEDFFQMERMRESEQPRPLFGMKPRTPAPTAPTGQMPGVTIGQAGSDPSASEKEWSAVPTLRSFVEQAPGPDSAVPTFVPLQQPFPKAPSLKVPAVSPTEPKEPAEAPVVSLKPRK